MTRRSFRDGGGFEEAAAHSRAVRVEAHVAVSGTASMENGVVLHPGDVYGQMRAAFAKALAAAAEFCARDWQGAVRAHRETYAGIDPANTSYFVAGFIPDEVELDAVVPELPPR